MGLQREILPLCSCQGCFAVSVPLSGTALATQQGSRKQAVGCQPGSGMPSSCNCRRLGIVYFGSDDAEQFYQLLVMKSWAKEALQALKRTTKRLCKWRSAVKLSMCSLKVLSGAAQMLPEKLEKLAITMAKILWHGLAISTAALQQHYIHPHAAKAAAVGLTFEPVATEVGCMAGDSVPALHG